MQVTKRNFLQFVFANILLVTVLSPILRTPYGIDDIYDSVWPYVRVSNGNSLLLDTKEWIYFFLNDIGKFNPISNLMSALTFEIFDTRISFKFAQLVSTIIMFNLLAYLSYIISNNFRVLILTLFATSILVSFRTEYDGILQYALHQKISNSFIFICLVFLFKGVRKNFDSNFYFVLCYIFFILSFLTYETSMTLGIIVIIFRLKYFSKSVLRNLIFIITFISMILFKFVVYSNRSETTMQAYITSNNLSDIFLLYLKFIVSSLPFSNNLDEISFLNLNTGDLIYIFFVFIFTSIFIFQLLNSATSAKSIPNSSDNYFNVLSVGVSLFFISPVIFAVSKGYSEATNWGMGFHFTILSTSGLILITTYFLNNLNYSKPLYIILFTVIYSLNFAHNLGVTASNSRWTTSAKIVGYPREAFFGAIRNGILSGVKETSSILLLPSAPWAENSVLRMESHNPDVSLTNSWWRFSEKPSALPSVCPEMVTICKTTNPQYVLLVSALDYQRSYVAFMKSDTFFIPKGYKKIGPLSDADFKIDAATTSARVMFLSGKPCENLHKLVLNSGYKNVVERDYDFKVPTYTIISQDLFWLRRINLGTCF